MAVIGNAQLGLFARSLNISFPNDIEGIALKVRQTTLRKHKTRTLPVAERPQNGWAFYRWP
jgi:hypothetical protein